MKMILMLAGRTSHKRAKSQLYDRYVTTEEALGAFSREGERVYNDSRLY